jgi:hypothetical protein
MSILICGVVYWFWTQNQYVLRKLHLLNNIVFEMRTQLNKDSNITAPDAFIEPTVYAPAPGSVMGDDEDLLHETLHEQVTSVEEEVPTVTPFQTVETSVGTASAPEIQDDLMPGGTNNVKTESVSNTSVIESMSLKELRRLGEQRGISGASSMKKTALITALREAPKPEVENFEATIDLS